MIITEPMFAFPSHACQRLLVELINKDGQLTNREELVDQISAYEKDINAKYIEYLDSRPYKELFE